MALTTTGDPDESEQLAQRLAKGRYTIEEAVKTLFNNEEGIDYDFMIANLRKLVKEGQVTVYEPSIIAPWYEPKIIRNDYEEAYWYDLNAMWLTRFDNIEWRFPDPLEKLVPDWSYWDCDHLSLQDAICLSVNITPDWAKYTKDIGRKNVLDISFKYSPRLTNALNWAQNAECPWRYDHPNGFKETNQVKLSEFARWVVAEKPDWAIPDEFRALAKFSETSQLLKSAKVIQKWQLKPGKAYPGYRLALFEFLEKEFKDGKEYPPKAYDFIAKLKQDVKANQAPEDIFVRNKGIDYKTKNGATNKADLKAINQAIDNLIIRLSKDE
jgi:hypothetical protein